MSERAVGMVERMKGEVRRARGPMVIAAISALGVVAAVVHQFLVPIDVNIGWAFRGFIAVTAAPYIVLGAAIAIRSPDNRIGTLLQMIGLLFAIAGVLEEYALHGLIYRPDSFPGAIYAAWVLQWAWVVMFGLSMFVFLLFPNGHFISRRWRRFSIFAAVSIVVAATGLGFAEGPLDSFTERPVFQNPLGVDGVTAEHAGMLLMFWLFSLVMSTVSLFIRFRRSSGIERLQLKWLAAGAVFTAVAFLFAGVSEGRSATTDTVGQTLVTVGIVLLPTTIGIAILRYRLYEIDVLINRALVYGVLTALLAGAYLGLVFALQAVLSPITAESDLAIAASTLAVAALFRPVRSRVQDFIDRRFYRRKFDAELTVSEFSSRLRDEVELGAVTAQLVDVVRDTMQPVHVSLWMAKAKGPAS